MDALEAIYSRRSIRQYRNEAVEEEQIDKIIRAAMAAPSAHNEQPWYFIVIKNR